MNVLMTITGPSAGGKTTLAQKLKESGLFDEAVSVTTRPMRAGEKEGVAYFFVSEEKFTQMLNDDLLVERVFVSGNNYGVSANEIDRIFREGKNATVVIEPNGVKRIHNYCQRHNIKMLSVYIDTPAELRFLRTIERLEEDLQAASTDEERQSVKKLYAKRMAHMATEESHWRDAFDYDLVIERFDPDTEHAAITRINAATMELSDE